jgi:crossover junction endodeoxyribonuclease RuvC
MGTERTTEAAGELILGIDPGTAVCGWGLIHRRGNRLRHVDHGAWRTPAKQPLSSRLLFIATELEALIKERQPQAVAVEQAFFGKNVQSALRLGEARGVILATSARCGLAPVEYPTANVKKALVGNGRADKTQVQFMLQRLLRMDSPPEPLDASDALALAYTLGLESSFQRAARR